MQRLQSLALLLLHSAAPTGAVLVEDDLYSKVLP
jgi:hypothetical protein